MQRCVLFGFVFMTLVAASITVAADLDMVLAAPQPPVRGGARVMLDLFLHNNTDSTITRNLPPSLPCRIHTSRTTVKASAALVDPEVNFRVEIPVWGFAKRQ
jgi:phospholipase A1/A2